MARPKEGVTPKNFIHVQNYFSRAFRFDRLRGLGWFESGDNYYDAKEAYTKLQYPNWDKNDAKSLDKRCQTLQKWIDTHIPNEKWQRCLLTIRQAKSRKKLKLRQLNLKYNVYLNVKILAEKKGVTMNALIEQLVEPVLNKIYRAEFEAELNPPKTKMITNSKSRKKVRNKPLKIKKY
jgi:macrodomain Ter protein organizer (MatP/YcbG family)